LEHPASRPPSAALAVLVGDHGRDDDHALDDPWLIRVDPQKVKPDVTIPRMIVPNTVPVIRRRRPQGWYRR